MLTCSQNMLINARFFLLQQELYMWWCPSISSNSLFHLAYWDFEHLCQHFLVENWMQIDADWCRLMLIDAYWCWLMLSDSDWCWLMLTDVCWRWFWFWCWFQFCNLGYSPKIPFFSTAPLIAAEASSISFASSFVVGQFLWPCLGADVDGNSWRSTRQQCMADPTLVGNS